VAAWSLKVPIHVRVWLASPARRTWYHAVLLLNRVYSYFLSHLLYISCSVCNKYMCAACTDVWMSYAQWRNSCIRLLFTYLSLSCFYWLLYSNLSGRVKTDFRIFTSTVTNILSWRFLAQRIRRISLYGLCWPPRPPLFPNLEEAVNYCIFIFMFTTVYFHHGFQRWRNCVYSTHSVRALGHRFSILELQEARDLAVWQDLERQSSNKTCNQTIPIFN
jgi:hypothetical protein